MEITTPLPLLGGLSAAQFMRRHWQKKPLLVRQAVPDMVPPIDRSALFALAEREEVESRLIRHGKTGWSLRHGPLPRRSLPSLKQPAWTLLVQGVDLHHEGIHALLRQFRFLPDARLDDLMISYASDGGGVGAHFDSYDVFLLQAQGRRRWSIGQQSDLRLQPGVPLKILERFEPAQSFVLEPGDMLYLPPRYAHDGVAVGGDCMTFSIGLRSPSAGELGADLLARIAQAHADEQMVRARQRIQEGLERDEFFLCYQPKVDMQRGVMVGVEALIRWQHPERGLLQPGQFVPLTEGDELAERMGDWVIGAALRQAHEWRSAGLRTAISVNVSPRHMMRWDFVDRLAQHLAQFPKLGAGTLELEILETTAISKFSTVARFVEACKGLGVPVAIDDFGTGYSSLTYLRQLPVSSVKIDQSFIRGMLESEQDRAIVQGILALLKALGRTPVAEGVETLEIGRALLEMGCTLAQGYGISMPLSACDIPQWVKDFERVPLWGSLPHLAPALPVAGAPLAGG